MNPIKRTQTFPFMISLAVFLSASFPQFVQAKSTIFVAPHLGYRAYIDGDIDDFNAPEYGIRFLMQPKKNIGFDVQLDRSVGKKRGFELTTTRLSAHIMWHQYTSANPHLYAGIGPAIVYAEMDRFDDDTVLAGDLLAGYYIPFGDKIGLAIDGKFEFLSLGDYDPSNFSNLSLGLELWIGLD